MEAIAYRTHPQTHFVINKIIEGEIGEVDSIDSTFGFYVFAVFFGIPYGGEGTVHPVINRQYFGLFPMGRTYGWQLFGAGLGMALGGIIPGLVFDLSNSYDIAILISCVSSLIGAFIVIILPKTSKELIDWNLSLEQT